MKAAAMNMPNMMPMAMPMMNGQMPMMGQMMPGMMPMMGMMPMPMPMMMAKMTCTMGETGMTCEMMPADGISMEMFKQACMNMQAMMGAGMPMMMMCGGMPMMMCMMADKA
jgi:hypothetical protein